MINITCVNCGQNLEIEDTPPGGEFSCPICDTSLLLPVSSLPGAGFEWYYAAGGQQFGPVSGDGLGYLIGAGTISGDTLVWREGMTNWIPAMHSELGLMFAAAPPSFGGVRQSQPPPIARQGGGGLVGNVNTRVASALGVDKIEGFSLSEFFSAATQKHSVQEIEEHFTFGTVSTTPPLSAIPDGWPKPWAFLRAMGFSIVVCVIFHFAVVRYEHPNLIPGYLFAFSFAIPCSFLLLFMELNVVRNVSLYQVIKMLFLGGAISLFATFLLSEVYGDMINWMNASAAGLTEEPAKLLAALILVKDKRYRFTLNGLLIGAAVGTGFTVFETAGYGLQSLFGGGVNAFFDLLVARGALSPFMHIPWTALAGAALWKVKGDREFQLGMLFDFRFLRVLGFSALLHILWNADFSLMAIPLFGDVKFLLLGGVAWVAVLCYVQDGLRQVARVKRGGPVDG